jgi:hypothetical protein
LGHMGIKLAHALGAHPHLHPVPRFASLRASLGERR